MTDAARWFREDAAEAVRAAIADAGGNEVFFVGSVDAGGRVHAVRVEARGHDSAVNAFVARARPGEVMIHNHPDGLLLPSDADLALAGRAGAQGIGFWIIDNDCRNVYRVVQPYREPASPPLDIDALRAFFAAGGPLARHLPGYKVRPAQVELAASVAKVLDNGGTALFEAGTGTGKSLAYLLPAVIYAQAVGRPVVVATGTIALQEQLLRKDLPAVAAVSPEPVRVALLKGRNNYVSLRRAWQLLDQPQGVLDGDHRSELEWLRQWLDTTPDGDRAGLPAEIGDEIWEAMQSEADNCLRTRCPHYQACHYFQSRRRAAGAHVLIVNHALLAADWRVRIEADSGFDDTALLPPYRTVVVDEAHALEGYARGQFGARVSELAVQRALHDLVRTRGVGGSLIRFKKQLIDRGAVLSRPLLEHLMRGVEAQLAAAAAVEQQSALWFSRLDDWLRVRAHEDAVRLPDPDEAFQVVAEEGRQLAVALEELAAAIAALWGDDVDTDELPGDLAGPWTEVLSRARRLETYARALRAVLSNQSPREVAWVERSGANQRPRLEIAPVDVGAILGEHIWRELRAAVLTSATLTTGDSGFAYVARGLGLDVDAAMTDVWRSPFDYERLVRLVLIEGVDVAAHGVWRGTGAEAVAALVAASHGSALVLCTSIQAVRDLAQKLRRDARLRGIAILAQGEAPSHELAKRFRADASSVLVGTATFWEGFDAAGDTLRHVIITRLPFAVPTHPLEQARQAWAKAMGLNPFMHITVPEAIMRFRQGFGRLVRGPEDWGAVSVLDSRIQSRGYGPRFLAALPPTAVLRGTIAEVVPQLSAWFAQQAARTAAPSVPSLP